MKLKIRHLLITTLLLMTTSSWGALTQEQEKKLKNFQAVPTAKLDDTMRQFTNADLLEIWNQHQVAKSIQEKRILKLIEEYYLRRADETAKSRLIYLFAAFIAYLTLILGFVFFIFKKQQKLTN